MTRQVLAGTALAIVLYLVLGAGAQGPAIFPDELCFLGWARTLLGGEFYRMGGASYCFPGYPALVALPALAVPALDPYGWAIVLNVAACGACWPLGARIGRDHLGMSDRQATAGGALVATYPPTIAYSQYAWPEPLLQLLALALFLAWCRAVERPDAGRIGALAASAVGLYWTHPRMLGVALLVVACALAYRAWRRGSPSAQRAVLAAFAVVVAIATMSWLKASVLPLGWVYDNLDPVGQIKASASTLSAGAAGKLAGQLTFVAWATLGLAWLPLARVLSAAYGREGTAFEAKLAIAPAALLATAALSAVFLASSDRFDTFFYGRYAGPLVAINLLAGLALCGRQGTVRLAPWLAGLAVLVGAGILVQGPIPQDADYSRIHVLGAQGLVDMLQARDGSVATAAIALLVAAMALATLLASRHWAVAASLVALLFAGLHASGESTRTAVASTPLPAALGDALSVPGCAIHWAPDVRERGQHYRAFSLQYRFPACGVAFLSEAEPCGNDARAILVVAAASGHCANRPGRRIGFEPGLVAIVPGPEPRTSARNRASVEPRARTELR